MPTTSRSSKTLRQLRIRLRILSRPMVWGSASVILLSLLTASRVLRLWPFQPSSTPPETIAQSSYSTPSPAARSVASPTPPTPPENIDLDTLPGFTNLLEPPATEAAPSASAPAGVNGISLLPGLSLGTAEQNASQNRSPSRNPFARSPRSNSSANRPSFDLLLSTSGSPATSAFAASMNAFDGNPPNTNPAPAGLPVNQLQSALQRQNERENDRQNRRSSSIFDDIDFGRPATDNRQAPPLDGTITGLPNPGRSLQPAQTPPLQGLPYAVPQQTSPPPGSTGYILPPALRSPNNAPNNAPITPAQSPLVPANPYPMPIPAPATPNLPQGSQLAPLPQQVVPSTAVPAPVVQPLPFPITTPNANPNSSTIPFAAP